MTFKTKRYSQALLILVVPVILFTNPSMGSLDIKMERLVMLRFEVDEKSKEYDRVRNKFDMETSTLETQIADTKTLLCAQRAKKRALVKIQNEQLRATESLRQRNNQYVQPALQSAEILKHYIEQSIPFKRKERLAAVDRIVNDVKSKQLDAASALSRLWRNVEDELKLTRETGLYQQIITSHNEQLLVDVVRIGMSLLYYKTDADQFGIARLSDDGRTVYSEITHSEQREALQTLFEAQRKQIRTGKFQLLLPALGNVKKRER